MSQDLDLDVSFLFCQQKGSFFGYFLQITFLDFTKG